MCAVWVLGDVQFNWKGYGKLALFDQCLAIFQKLYKIKPELQFKTNRKSFAIYRMVPFPMILSDA